MAKAIVKLQYVQGKEKGWDKLSDLIDSFEEIVGNNIEKAMEEDAKNIAAELATNFDDYITNNSGKKEFKKTYNPTIRINKEGNRYDISMTGKNLLYYEFGTGDTGERTNGGYSKSELARYGYKYNDGPNVIRAGEANDYLSFQDLPKWYIGFLHKHPGIDRHNWWMSPYGISNGIEAGLFMYHTWDNYVRGLAGDDEDADDTYQSGADITGIKKTGIRTLRTSIVNDVKKYLK